MAEIQQESQFTSKDLTCQDCAEVWSFSIEEQEFFAEKKFEHEPLRCKPCRKLKRVNRYRRNRKPRADGEGVVDGAVLVEGEHNPSTGGRRRRVVREVAPAEAIDGAAPVEARVRAPRKRAPRKRRPRGVVANDGPRYCYGFQTGECVRGDECRFVHEISPVELVIPPRRPRRVYDENAPRPVQYCYAFQKGECDREKCRFVHEISEEGAK